MAADTAAKRRSAMLLTMPFRGPPYPQTAIDAGERAAGLFLYALSSATGPRTIARGIETGVDPSLSIDTLVAGTSGVQTGATPAVTITEGS